MRCAVHGGYGGNTVDFRRPLLWTGAKNSSCVIWKCGITRCMYKTNDSYPSLGSERCHSRRGQPYCHPMSMPASGFFFRWHTPSVHQHWTLHVSLRVSAELVSFVARALPSTDSSFTSSPSFESAFSISSANWELARNLAAWTRSGASFQGHIAGVSQVLLSHSLLAPPSTPLPRGTRVLALACTNLISFHFRAPLAKEGNWLATSPVSLSWRGNFYGRRGGVVTTAGVEGGGRKPCICCQKEPVLIASYLLYIL